ncbi:hypothetical protein D9758_008292 [Tetrapyrgos nigripes]|uniref:Uncharacterized protein n=1 Tax=Tetrapyrgos nigripes TaxID=182062 RepID=A0A8H5G1F4_9AGAR|nr:hypothetical protein D9758_008292 [Tetrapyrgos nigripes]
MHPALSISELLQGIFRLASPSGKGRMQALLNYALVCHAWKPDALELLMAVLEDVVVDIRMIARALGAMMKGGVVEERLIFPSPPGPDTWRRFQGTFSLRVRSIVVDLKTENDSRLLEVMAKTRPHSFDSFFPNLRRMTVIDDERLLLSDCRDAILMLMNRSVESLSLKSKPEVEQDEDPPSDLPLFFEDFAAIGDRMPHLTSLLISGAYTIDLDIGDEIAILCSRLPSLTELELPSLNDYTRVIESVARHCPQLQGLTCFETELIAAQSVLPMPSLKRLNLGLEYLSELVRFMNQHPVPALETCLFFFDPIYTEPQDLRNLFTLLSSLPHITKIEYSMRGFGEDFELNFGELRPVLQCRNIRELHCGHSRISLTDADLVILGRSLPCLESLMLSPFLHDLEEPEDMPTLRGLIDLTEHATKLRYLQLRLLPIYPPTDSMDNDATTESNKDELTLDSIKSFHCLEQLCVCRSLLDPDWTLVTTLVLGRILPLKCRFRYCALLDHDGPWGVDREEGEVMLSIAEWEKVSFGLKFRAAASCGKVALPSL